MQSVFSIIGTAGHIDHGKTTLVKALTGQDTDRLKEEKERGITIDLGFAALQLHDGRKVGVVDVPGHERFIRNMLAGAVGIDVILFIVAANEGVMPQTREHLEILQLLGLQHGVIALTKSDLVEPDWLELVQEDVYTAVQGTFLENARILPVSSVTMQGIPELLQELERLLELAEPRSKQGTVRMPIDRVFSVAGFGTVVTGTLWRGTLRTGDMLHLYPDDLPVRVRSLEVHGEKVDQAYAGQRVAVNITGIDKHGVRRGSVLATAGALEATELSDIRLKLLSGTPKALQNGTRVRFHIGTAEVMGRIVLLDRDQLQPGEDALAQIRLEEPIACEKQDRFIIRSYSPVFTIGGGTVIDPYPKRLHRRNRDYILEEIEQREKMDIFGRVLQWMREHPFVEEPSFIAACMNEGIAETKDELAQVLQTLEDHGEVERMLSGTLLTERRWIAERMRELTAITEEYYKQRRYDVWIPRSHMFQHWSDWKSVVSDQILYYAEEKEIIDRKGEFYRLHEYQPVFTKTEQQILQTIRQELLTKGFQPPLQDELEQFFKGKERIVRELLGYLRHTGEIVEVEKKLWLAKQTVDQGVSIVRQLCEQNAAFTVAEFRDQAATSRKIAVAFLEHLDRQKLTKREGERRICL